MSATSRLTANRPTASGVIGGYVHSDLDYDARGKAFDFDGGQVGGYATYLRGGLFVDTLVNVHLMEVETRTLGFPNSLDATTTSDAGLHRHHLQARGRFARCAGRGLGRRELLQST